MMDDPTYTDLAYAGVDWSKLRRDATTGEGAVETQGNFDVPGDFVSPILPRLTMPPTTWYTTTLISESVLDILRKYGVKLCYRVSIDGLYPNDPRWKR